MILSKYNNLLYKPKRRKEYRELKRRDDRRLKALYMKAPIIQ
jgi:hypothetical protein